MIKALLATLTILLSTLSASYAATLQKEWVYRQAFCPGQKQIVMPDKTRADCIKDNIVWEVDFDFKWYEAIGQSTHYGRQKLMRPGIALIVEDQKKCYLYWRAHRDVENYRVNIRGDWLKPVIVQIGPAKCVHTISGGVN